MTYDTRQVTHGTEQVAFSGGSENQPIYSTGVSSFSPSVDQDSKKVYADARTHITLMNAKSETIEISNYQYNAGELAQMGYTEINGGFIDVGSYQVFDVQRILTVQKEDGSTTERLEVYYGCTSSDYTESDDEDEDEINPKIYTRTLTVAGKDFETYGHVTKFVIERTEENAKSFDAYKTKIMEPSDFQSVTG